MSESLSQPFDTANEEGLGALTPPANYPAEIVEAKVNRLKSGKGEAIDISWVIDGGEYDNRYLFQKIILEHESEAAQAFGRRKFKSLLDALLIKDTVTNVGVLVG